jgi:hypothetical protein
MVLVVGVVLVALPCFCCVENQKFILCVLRNIGCFGRCFFVLLVYTQSIFAKLRPK